MAAILVRPKAMFCCAPASLPVDIRFISPSPLRATVARVAMSVIEAKLGDAVSVNQHIEASPTCMVRQLTVPYGVGWL